MVLYRPGPYHGIPPAPGYTYTRMGFSGGPEGVSASGNAKAFKGPIRGLILGSSLHWGKCSIAPGANLPSSSTNPRSIPRQFLKLVLGSRFPLSGMLLWAGTRWSETPSDPCVILLWMHEQVAWPCLRHS